jgi:hypothetical protein
VKANREASILCKIFQIEFFCKTCANIAQHKHDEMYLFENNPFVNDCANICEKFFWE